MEVSLPTDCQNYIGHIVLYSSKSLAVKRDAIFTYYMNSNDPVDLNLIIMA